MMLHQIYLFLRVIEESTYIYPDELARGAHKRVHSTRSLRYPSLRTYRRFLGDDLDEISGGDFELALLGQAQDGSSLFDQIYGIPETLLSLLSHCTALANDISAQKASSSDLSISHDLAQRSKSLEDQITLWQYEPQQRQNGEDDESLGANAVIMGNLIRAIHGALSVFFYRRISNLNPSILQGLVDQTIDHLLQCEQEKLNAQLVNCGIAWPGFIAAAEAIGEERQSKCWVGCVSLRRPVECAILRWPQALRRASGSSDKKDGLTLVGLTSSKKERSA